MPGLCILVKSDMTTGFWIILLATLIYGILHSLLASNRAKRMAEQAWGVRAARRWYRLGYVMVVSVTVLPVLALPVFLPDVPIYTIPSPWRWLTLLGQGLGLAALAAGVIQTGALRFMGIRQVLEDSPQSGGAQPERLVVTGLYRWVRHPLYSASLLILWLSPVMTWNFLALSLGFTAYMLIGAYFFEEPKLIEQFGSAYEEYRRKTPMIIPGLKLGR